MSSPAKYFQKCVQKVKVLSYCLYSFRKMGWFNLALQQSNFQFAPPKRFKIVMLTPKLDMRILLYAKFLLRKYFKSSHYRRKTRVWVSRMSKKFFRYSLQGLFPKLKVLFEARSSDMYTSLVYSSPAFKIIPLSIHFPLVAYSKYV